MKHAKKTAFDQFLFSHFNIKKETKVAQKEAVVFSKAKECIFNKGFEVKYLDIKSPAEVSKASVVKKQVARKVADAYLRKERVASLAEVIESIPDKVRKLDLSDLARKHESEWYHAFRDIKEEIESEITKTHYNKNGKLQFKHEIKEFWDELEEHIEKVLLELERIFQAFPQISRVAVIYLLSIIISVPLLFFSVDGDTKIAFDANKTSMAKTEMTGERSEEAIKLSPEIKSAIVANNAQKILNSGKVVYKVSEGSANARVAGAYEENAEMSTADRSMKIKQQMFRFYKYVMNLKDDLSGGIK